jgi:transposase-like protein
VAVRWYLRYGLSYRDVEELLAECGIEVDHVSGHCCVDRKRHIGTRPRPLRFGRHRQDASSVNATRTGSCGGSSTVSS